MPDTKEGASLMDTDVSYREEQSAARDAGPAGNFRHVPSMGALPWKKQYLAAISTLGLCVVLLALASFSEGLRSFSWLLALASLGSLGFMVWVHVRQQAWLSQSARSETDHVNAAIDALANHLKVVAAGDLAHPAPSSPGAMGRIGQILDATFKSFAGQVSELQENAARVEQNAIDTTTATNALLEQAQAQASHQDQTASRLGQIAADMAWVTENSRQVSQHASSALDLSSGSAAAVSDMSGKLDEIRAAAVDAGTRVSRLGSFSKEMTSLVDLLSRLADQAGVVALQASLQSEKAGASGLGFKIVSESMKGLAAEIETLARRGSSITTAAASDIDASSHAVEQVVMGSDDVARLMDVASDSAQQSMETGKDLAAVLDSISARAHALVEQAKGMVDGPRMQAPDIRQARDVVALVASARELNQKLGRLRP